VRLELPESSWLELKRDLPLSQGALGWRTKQQLHPSERDGLAKEIVAIANTYGGVVVVGVDESDDTPKCASALADPIPLLHDLVDRLRTSLGAYIDPPIPGLQVSGIPASAGGSEGYVVITVPASAVGPHGYGRPPQVYFRRDDRSEPGSMRDIQNTFWESRSNRERVEAELSRLRAQFNETSLGDLCFQFVAISEHPMNMVRLPAEMRSGKITRVPNQILRYQPGSAADFPYNTLEWRPTATGVERISESSARIGGSHWEIDEGGIVSVTGYNNLRPDGASSKQFYPGWYSKTAGSIIALAEILSGWMKVESGWILAGHFKAHDPTLLPHSDNWLESFDLVNLTVPRSFRPIRVGGSQDADNLNEIADRVWSSLGVIRPPGDESIQNGIKEVLQFK
jgi:hypothetical protein